jgi:hypothetical protein
MKDIDKVVANAFKDIKKNLNENILDLPRASLCPEIWDKNENIHPEVKREVLKRFDSWKKKYADDMKVVGIYILGSITTFQYNGTSDVDVNFIVDWPKSKIDKVWRTLPNGNNYKDTNHPINLYVTSKEKTTDIDTSKTLYDLKNEKWVRKPNKNDIAVPQKYSLEIARLFMDGIDSRMSELARDKKELEQLKELLNSKNSFVDINELEKEVEDKKEEIFADKDALRLAHYIVKGLRKEGFSDDEWKFKFNINVTTNGDPNKTLNNLIYKELERFGYLAKLDKIEKEN